MEKSLDQLIEHLLGEIAVCGPAGVTVADLTAFVDDFYYGTCNNGGDAVRIAQVVDDAFIASVWRWLGKHPDISLGANKEHNTTALKSLAHSGVPLTEQSSTLPRISVIGDRIYQAICGHVPDSRRVFKSEYGLLLIIAAARSDGILQAELGRIAGQDKRSVPKRTDSLHAKGYIIKETVVVGGRKSSRLTLRRFATKAQIQQAEEALANITSHTRHERTVQHVINDVVSNLATLDLIEAEDLAKRVKMSSQVAQKTLLKILRVLTKAGYVKKVKAAIGASAHTGEPKICFRRMRDIAEADLNGFTDPLLDLTRPISEVLEEIDADLPGADSNAAEGVDVAVQWNPDRNIVNAIQHAAALAGVKGISNASARKFLTGMNIKRPIESQLHRISFASLAAQPDHLRHLAVIRSNEGAAGGPQYVHHSFPAFLQAVETGKLDTSTVPGSASVLRDQHQVIHTFPTGQSTELDAFGFPPVNTSLLLRNGTATLADCVRSMAIEDMSNNVDDASDVDTRPHKRLKTAATSTPFASHSANSPTVSSTQRSTGIRRATRGRPKNTHRNTSLGKDSAVRGRPRKFLAGTEKFWQHHFFKAKVDAEGPDAGKAGAMNHPAGKTIFQNRPELLDETVVQAREAGLPVPKSADDISTEWIQRTQAVLQRSGPGAYVTPAGIHLSRALHTSQMLIIRSDKLHIVDFRERPKVYAYRFLTSMVAHSMQNQRWYPTKPPRKKRARPLPPLKFDVEYPEELLDAFGKLPRKGVFYDSSTPQAPLLPSQLADVPKVTPEEYRELMAETDIDSEVERREQKEKIKATPATPRASRAEAPDSPRQDSPRSFDDQIDGFEDTPLRRLRRNRDKSNQHTTEWAGSGGADPTVGSPYDSEDSALEAADHNEYDDGRSDEQDDDDDAAGGSENAVTLQLTPQQESPRSTFQPLKKARPYSLGQPLLPVQTKSASLLDDPFGVPSGSPRSLKVSMRMPVGASALVTTSTSASAENLEEPSTGLDNDRHQKERARMLSSSSSRGAGIHCRKALLSLLTASGGLAPKNIDLLRRSCGAHWRQQGQSGLPSAAMTKSSLKGLVDSGLLKEHTFSFRSLGGLMLSRSILFFPEMQIADAKVQHLKQEVLKADMADYIPPHWEDQAVTMDQPALPSSDTVEDGSETVENEEALLLETDTAVSRPKRVRKPTARAAASRTPSISRGSRPTSLSPSLTTGFLSLRTSRSPSVTSRSSASSSNQSDANVGFLTLKVPRLGTLPQVQQFNAKLQTPGYLKTAPLVAPITDPTAPKKQRKPRAVKPKKDTSLQKIMWKTPRLPESLHDLLNEQYKHDNGIRSAPVQDEPENVDGQLETVLRWEERLAEKLVETKVPWTFINFITTSPTIALEGLGFWYRVEFSADGTVSMPPIDNVESWLPFRQALEKLRLEPGLGLHTPGASTGRRITRKDTGSIRKRPRFDFDDVGIEDGARRKRARKQADTDFEDEDGFIEPSRVKRPHNRKKGNPVESQHATILSKTSNEDIFRIALSVVLVSTLVGGTEKTINWPIVNKLNPTLLRSTVTSRWKAIAFTYPDEVDSMTSSLRSLYLEAVQASEVPMVNLANHAESAWQEILNWALTIQPNFLKENVLPASRAALRTNFSLEYSTQQNIRPIFAPAASLRTSEREEHVVSVPFGAPILQLFPVEGLAELARALVLSTLLTTNSLSGIAKLASQKLGSISSDRNTAEQATATALRELLADKVIVKVDISLKRAPALIEDGNRAYNLTEKMNEVLDLKRIINRGVLLEAMDYKLDVLDATFEADKVVEIPNQSQITNGQMVAVVNLLSSGMLRIRPRHEAQKSRYGVAWERVGYQSKQIDAKDLGFEVVLERTAAYRFGDMAETVRGDGPTRGAQEQHPMWIDLHGDVLGQLWEKVLAAVVGLAGMRPGVHIAEIREMLGGVLTRWEVETVLTWAEARRFVRRTGAGGAGSGWETDEWWWMCLGKDTDWGGSWTGDE